MKKYRPRSWSQQSREIADKLMAQIDSGYTDYDDIIHFFSEPYRGKLIDERAVRRVSRIKKSNQLNKYSTWSSYEKRKEQGLYGKRH